MQDVWPVLGDQSFSDFATDQSTQFFRGYGRIQEVEPLGGQIADTRDKPIRQQRGDGEDVIRKATDVSVLFFDLPPSLMHQQAVEDVGGFVQQPPKGGCHRVPGR